MAVFFFMFNTKISKMANTKEYKIVINGVQESINAVEALNQQLNALEKRIKTLESSNVKVNATSKGGGGNASALNEEAAVQREINKLKQEGATLDAKIAAAQDEVYKKVDATKQLYKETIADQKAIAAQERLTADAYSNTMQGMKAQLADIKAVINTTDLGDSDKIKQMTQDANELTNKLKQMEEAYGQFGRNVGNYANGVAEGLQKVKINVGGTVREFDNARQAAKVLGNELKTLAVNGQQGTKAFKDLQQVVIELESNIKDAKKPMDALMDSMQSVVAIASVGQGIRGMFGVDDVEMQKTIKNLIALQNVMKGIETINQQIKAREGIGAWIAPFTTSIDKATARLLVFNRALLGTGKAAKVAAVSIKAFSKALKLAISAGILIAVDLLVEKLMDLVENFKKVDKATAAAKETEEELARAYAEGSAKLLKYQTIVKNFKGTKEQEKKVVSELNSELGDSLGTYKSIAEWMDVLMNKGQDYIDYLKLQAKAQAAFNQYVQAMQDEDKVKEMSIDEFEAWWQKILPSSWTAGMTNKARVAATQEAKEYTKLREEAYLKSQDELNRFMEKHKIGINAPQVTKENGKKTQQATADVQETLNQLTIRLMREGLNQKLRQLDEEERQTLNKLKKNAKTTAEELKQIQNAYAALRMKEIEEYLKGLEDKINETAKNINNIKFDINDKQLERQISNIKGVLDAFSESKPKLVNLLTRQEMDEIVGKNPLSAITEMTEFTNLKNAYKKDKKVGEEYYAWLEDFVSRMDDLSKENFRKTRESLGDEEAFELLEAHIETEYKDILAIARTYGEDLYGLEEKDLKDNTGLLEESFLYTRTLYENNFSSLLMLSKGYYEKLAKLREEAIKNQTSQEEYNENERYRLQQEDLLKTYEELTQTINNYTGKDKKYLEQMKKDREVVFNQMQEALVLHWTRLGTIQKAGQDAITKSNSDTISEQKAQIEKFLDDEITMYSNFQSKLNDAINKGVVPNGFWGFDIVKTKKNFEEVLNAADETVNGIDDAILKVNLLFETGFITRGTMQVIMSRLGDMKNSVKASVIDINTELKNLSKEFNQQLLGVFNQTMNTISDIMSSMLEIEEAALDEEQDKIDKENDKLDEALDKQEDIVREHKDNIKSIEDELANARGDRRQHLIDQINAEIEAQRRAAAEEAKIKKQQEAQQRKQDALDKKRRQKEKEVAKKQAVISAAVAITNAFAQPPIWVGIAMAALIAAQTAMQIAAIDAQQFGNGGQLDGGVAQGKRHSEGGIPVLGGRASIEGGEFITNRQTTAKNVDLLEYINAKHRKLNIDDFIDFYSSGNAKKSFLASSPRAKYADGGTLPMLSNDYSFDDRLLDAFEKYSERDVVVSVVDINSRQAAVKNVQVLAGLEE